MKRTHYAVVAVVVLCGLMLCFVNSVTVFAQEALLGSSAEIEGGFRGSVYFLEPGTSHLPDFSTLTPVGTVFAEELNVAPRSFSGGFPGVTDRFEWFAVVYTGRITISESRNYAFRVLSDDGAKLYIDNQLVIDNDGVHPPVEKRGELFLNAGRHDVKVEYFQGPAVGIALQVFIDDGVLRPTADNAVLLPAAPPKPLVQSGPGTYVLVALLITAMAGAYRLRCSAAGV